VSDIVSRWVVAQHHDVADADRDPSGYVRADVLERWIAAARDAYLERCSRLRAVVFDMRSTSVVDASRLGRAPTAVRVSAGAKEVWPDAFSVAVRVRARGADDAEPVDVQWIVAVASGVSSEIRDQLIALEHGARHTN
jgi:hypothetical protein